MDIHDGWLTSKEAGKYLGFSDWSIRSFCKRRLLKHSKLPGQSGGYRFRREWLDDFLESRAVLPKESPQPVVVKTEPELRLVGSDRFAAAVARIQAKQSKQSVS